MSSDESWSIPHRHACHEEPVDDSRDTGSPSPADEREASIHSQLGSDGDQVHTIPQDPPDHQDRGTMEALNPSPSAADGGGRGSPVVAKSEAPRFELIPPTEPPATEVGSSLMSPCAHDATEKHFPKRDDAGLSAAELRSPASFERDLGTKRGNMDGPIISMEDPLVSRESHRFKHECNSYALGDGELSTEGKLVGNHGPPMEPLLDRKIDDSSQEPGGKCDALSDDHVAVDASTAHGLSSPGAVPVDGPGAAYLDSYTEREIYAADPPRSDTEVPATHVTATAVDVVDGSRVETVPIAEAKPLRGGICHSRRIFLWLLALAAVVVAVFTPVALLKTKDVGAPPPPTLSDILPPSSVPSSLPSYQPTVSSPPSSRPTASPSTERFSAIRDVLVPVSGTDALSDESTPQYRAMRWLADEDEAAVDVEDARRIVIRYAMAVLYFSTSGENWDRPYGFLSDRHECQWNDRVDCSADRVDLLTLDDNGLNGTLPPEIGLLTDLQTLYLDGNSLRGTIPIEMGQLGKLEILHMDRNQLSGPIEHLGKLGRLEQLLLHKNLLSGTIGSSWMANMSKLQELALFENELSGTISSSVGRMTSLVHLDMSENPLIIGHIPTQMENLVHLTLLALFDNNLSGTIFSGIGNLLKLEELKLWRNNLTGPLPHSIGELTSLSKLDAAENSLTGTIPLAIGNVTNLKYINLHTNLLSGSIPEIGSLSKLEELMLYRNRFSGSLAPSLGSLPQLRDLGLAINSISGTIPATFTNLKSAEIIWIHGNDIEGNITFLCNAMNSDTVITVDCDEVECSCCCVE